MRADVLEHKNADEEKLERGYEKDHGCEKDYVWKLQKTKTRGNRSGGLRWERKC